MKKKINRKKAVNSMTQKSVHIKKRKIKNIKTQKRKCANNRKSKIKIYIACLLSSFKQKCEYAFQGTDVKDETSLSDSSTLGRNKKLKVCVIGAGPAGLSMTRHLSKSLDKFDIITFEKYSDVGGTWIYTEKSGFDEHGYPIHTSMFKNLRTNLPKEVMNFPDWPVVKGSKESCVMHHIILKYLKNYTNHFCLRRFIKFNTAVINVKLKNCGGLSDQWSVKVKNLVCCDTKEYTFDAVIVCNGHYFDPCIPKIPGLEDFCGKLMHSHSYKVPKPFKGKRVVCLGGSSSGLDIAIETATVATKVYLSHNNPEKIMKKNNCGVTEVKGIDRFENGKFILKDNKKISVDVLIFCTGYNYCFPFLDKNTGISVDDKHIKPLYKHMFNIDHPSMIFVGIPMGIVPFALFHVQSQYILAVLEGKINLPSKQIMNEKSKLKPSEKHTAHFISNQWELSDEMAREAGFPPLPPYYKIGCDAWSIHRKKNPATFKRYNLIIGADQVSVKITPICSKCWGNKL